MRSLRGEQVTLDAPLDAAFHAVFRLVVAGIAEQADFGFEEIDDLQLALERLLVEADGGGRVTATFEIADGGVRTRVGPLSQDGLARALQADGDGGALTLGRILATVVDSYGVEELGDGQMVVRLEKLRGTARQ